MKWEASIIKTIQSGYFEFRPTSFAWESEMKVRWVLLNKKMTIMIWETSIIKCQTSIIKEIQSRYFEFSPNNFRLRNSDVLVVRWGWRAAAQCSVEGCLNESARNERGTDWSPHGEERKVSARNERGTDWSPRGEEKNVGAREERWAYQRISRLVRRAASEMGEVTSWLRLGTRR